MPVTERRRMRQALALALAVGLLAPSAARAAVILHLHGVGGGGPDVSVKEVTVWSGQSFALHATLEVDNNEAVTGLGFWLFDAQSAGFSITLRTLAPGSPYTVATSTNAQITNTGNGIAPPGPDNALNPVNDRDLGVHLDGQSSPPGNQLQHLLALTILVDSTVAGTEAAPVAYPIMASHSGAGIGYEWVDANFDPHSFDGGAAPRTFTVRVIPEPASASLLAAGLIVVSARRRSICASARSGAAR